MTPEYKKLAYERATLQAIVRLAKENFLPKEGADDPELDIESEDLPRVDCLVPTEYVIGVVTKLQNLESKLAAEMQRFQFTKAESSYESDWKQEERPSQASPEKAGAPAAKGKGKGGKGGQQAPAAKSR